MALVGAALPSTGGRSRAVSRPGHRWSDYPGQPDGRCEALEEHGRFSPAGAGRPLPEPATEKRLRALRGHRPGRCDRAAFRERCHKAGPGARGPALRPRRRGHGPDLPNTVRTDVGSWNMREKIGTAQHRWIRWGRWLPSGQLLAPDGNIAGPQAR